MLMAGVGDQQANVGAEDDCLRLADTALGLQVAVAGDRGDPPVRGDPPGPVMAALARNRAPAASTASPAAKARATLVAVPRCRCSHSQRSRRSRRRCRTYHFSSIVFLVLLATGLTARGAGGPNTSCSPDISVTSPYGTVSIQQKGKGTSVQWGAFPSAPLGHVDGDRLPGRRED